MAALAAACLLLLSAAAGRGMGLERPGVVGRPGVGNYNGVVTFLIFVVVTACHLLAAQVAAYVARRRTTPRTR